MKLLETLIPQQVCDPDQPWRPHVAGDLGCYPTRLARALKAVVVETADRPRDLTLAIGYDWQQDVVRAVKAALQEQIGDDDRPRSRLGRSLTVQDVDQHFGGGAVRALAYYADARRQG